MKCNRCGFDVQMGMNTCPHCGNSLNYYDSNIVVNNEKVNVGLVVLAVFFPFIGFILFFLFLNKSPKTAKACGLGALITVLVEILIGVLMFALIFFSVSNTINVNENVSDDYEIIENFDDEDSYFDDEETDVLIGEVSNDWKTYQISYNGKLMTLPISYNDFSSTTGFKLKELSSTNVLKNNYYMLANLYKNDKLGLSGEIYNDFGSETIVSNCKITRLSQRKSHISNNVGQVVFPGNLKVNDEITEDKLIMLFGQPNDKRIYSSSITYLYNADPSWTTTNYYKIVVVDGIIDELTLDNR